MADDSLDFRIRAIGYKVYVCWYRVLARKRSMSLLCVEADVVEEHFSARHY